MIDNFNTITGYEFFAKLPTESPVICIEDAETCLICKCADFTIWAVDRETKEVRPLQPIESYSRYYH